MVPEQRRVNRPSTHGICVRTSSLLVFGQAVSGMTGLKFEQPDCKVMADNANQIRPTRPFDPVRHRATAVVAPQRY